MSECKAIQKAIAETLALEELSDDVVSHAEACADCGEVLERYRALALLTTRARRAAEREGDLPASAWVRIRAAVDEEASRAAWPPALRWLGVAAAAAAGVVIGLALVDGVGGEPGEGAASRVGGRALVAVERAVPAPPSIAPAASEDGARVAVADGQVLDGGATGRTLVAFGRHEIRLAAATRVKVGRWARDKMLLELEAGEVTCDVHRAHGEDVFEVRAGDVGVVVLGTIFTVTRRAGEAAVGVAVTRGRVAVTDGAGVVREVAAGESIEVGGGEERDGGARVSGATQPQSAVGAGRPRSDHPRGPRVIQIEVPDQAMAPTDAASGLDVSESLAAIEEAVDAGQCVAAMKALGALKRAVGAKRLGPRAVLLEGRCTK